MMDYLLAAIDVEAEDEVIDLADRDDDVEVQVGAHPPPPPTWGESCLTACAPVP